MAWARPKPTSGGLAKFNGYKDSAGSACIQSISVLNGLPGRPNQKGDVQAVLNLVSDSDALAGHHCEPQPLTQPAAVTANRSSGTVGTNTTPSAANNSSASARAGASSRPPASATRAIASSVKATS